MSKIMQLWHATSMDNLESIFGKGILPGAMNEVFLADDPKWAATFAFLKFGHGAEIVSLPVTLPKSELRESFDHDSGVFNCRCYTVSRRIKPKEIKFDKALRWKEAS